MKRYMVYVSYMGLLMKMTNKKWEKYLSDFAKTGIQSDLCNYAETVSNYIYNVTDWTAEQAKDELELINEQ